MPELRSGKFHGVISPKTPRGSRYVSTATPGRVESTVTPWRRSASPAKNLKMRAARMTSPLPSGSVLPSSRDSRRPRSSARAMMSRADLVEQVRAHFGAGIRPRRETRLSPRKPRHSPWICRRPEPWRRCRRVSEGLRLSERGRARDPLTVDVMGKLFCVAHVVYSIQLFSRPRRIKLRIRSAIPNDHGGARSQVVTLFSNTPSFSVDTRTTSPFLCVKPCPATPRSTIGANMVPRNSAKPSG